MNFKTKNIPLSSLIISVNGIIYPKCDTCTSDQCDNPIENCNVAIQGVIKKMRLMVKNHNPSAVIECEGYTQDGE